MYDLWRKNGRCHALLWFKPISTMLKVGIEKGRAFWMLLLFSFDGTGFEPAAETNYPHKRSLGFTTYNDQPFAIGSYYNPYNLKTEVYEKFRTWTTLPDYPFTYTTG